MLKETSRRMEKSRIRDLTRLSGSSSMFVVVSDSRLETPSLMVDNSSLYADRLSVKVTRFSSLVI